MLLHKLENAFFNENEHLVEVLDKDKSGWNIQNKTRGYGILVVNINNLRFGIPLRSHIKHKDCYRTGDTKGLDYSKAVLLVRDEYISDDAFMIPQNEFLKIKEHAHFIEQKFNKYILHYIEAVNKNDVNVLRAYRFSTLQNYHRELGLLSI
ncbi:type III toxin-antitoxin system TenpIN family toxin [Pseudoduganella danionis]|uniref:type III toxin-antitoxin system TenpIN family toxin n=1 Tax=Pseudoduganella danionis TaxID=1890295 RepID=UPI0035EBEF31